MLMCAPAASRLLLNVLRVFVLKERKMEGLLVSYVGYFLLAGPVARDWAL